MAKDLQVSEYQALILLQFNDSGDEGITYAALAEATGIGKPNLDRALVSFTATKSQRVLISQPLVSVLQQFVKYAYLNYISDTFLQFRQPS